MKRLLLLVFTLGFLHGIIAQTISVSSFRLLETDLTANTAGTMEIDQNGETAALIKVVTTQTGFSFDGGALGVVKTKQNSGEIWIYVPHGLKRISISQPDYGVLRDYYFNIPIEAARTYEMILKLEGNIFSFSGDTKEYHNYRFGYTIQYPSIMHQGMEPRNHDGISFIYQDVTFTVAANYDIWEDEIDGGLSNMKSFIDKVSSTLHPDAENKIIGEDYYIIKGSRDGLLNYQKSIITKNLDEENIWINFYLDYPKEKEQKVIPLLQYINDYKPIFTSIE